jgi:predicted dehydrogenase
VTYNVFIYGLGSIGQRYARLLRDTYGEDLKLYTIRRRKRIELIESTLQSSSLVDPTIFYGIIEVSNFNELPKTLDLSIIASPIHLHKQDLIDVCSFTNSNKILESRQNDIFMSFQARYSKLLETLKFEIDLINPEEMYSYKSWFSENLESMHPYEDYRTSHMGNVDQQGDPLSCFSHDIDIVLSLFGEMSVIEYRESKKSDLQISTPDFQRITCESKETFKLTAQLDFDFIGWPSQRGGELMFKGGRMKWDWLKQELNIIDKSRGVKSFNFAEISRDDQFKEMLAQLLNTNSSEEIKAASIADAIKVDSFIQAASNMRKNHG